MVHDVNKFVQKIMPTYHKELPDCFYEAIVENVIETSAFKDEGYYSEDDISLVFQRIVIRMAEEMPNV